MRKTVLQSIGIIGGVLTAGSIIWEYARMNPAYRFLVVPWSFRGFESVHGAVAVVIGLALAAATAVTMRKDSTQRARAIGIVIGIVLAATIVAVVFNPGIDVEFNSTNVVLLGFLAGMIIMRGAQRYLTRSGVAGKKPRTSIMFLVLLGGSAAASAAGLAALPGTAVPFGVSGGIVILLAMLGLLSISAAPLELAATRMLIYASLIASGVIGLSGGAMRSTLLRFQDEATQLPAQYKDAQVTWGYFLANIGVVLVFLGAVSLWGRRKDALQAAQRIAAQRAAAAASAAEIEAARVKAGLG